ncbi:MAG: MetQ/NlpA family ABC transporter substrate-binding protein [Helicobacter sp.]|uniref:MetQ/NlpA family ABC transporter substrate-binding protein n=1 Tax=Helicobacter sp. TaxID=218 RepID=UPI0025C69116|nr:MetQ/NlpA family ABC transporter substrate-binding protein [Helicobacter sp.]MCH5314029.1 MetQ/NlpA family ABC transporter substrate-binding protein [Helicobacter sp.]
MKKLGILLLAGLAFFGCGDEGEKNEATSSSTDTPQQEKVVLKVGATPVPHAEILEFIKPDLEAQGIDLQIVSFTDYITPNSALEDGSLDANFHQHKPFLDSIKADKGYKLEPIATIHVEPIGLYSNKFKSIDELGEGAVIGIPNDPSNGGRALLLLEAENLIKLKDSSNLNATELDIVENPKNLKIKPLEAALLPRTLDDVDAAVINGNYALQAGLSSNDALILEGAQSPYANILVVQESRVNDENLQKLKNALQSQKVKDFIQEKYKGEIVPAF